MGILMLEMFIIIGVVIYLTSRDVDSFADDLNPYNFNKQNDDVTPKN